MGFFAAFESMADEEADLELVNAQRKALGLAPLLPRKASSRIEVEEEKGADQDGGRDAELERRIIRRRERRKREREVEELSLGDKLEPAKSAKEWVVEMQKQRRTGAERALEKDVETSSKKPRIDSNEKGHIDEEIILDRTLENIPEEQTLILTLKDSEILEKKGLTIKGVNEQDDILENIDLSERHKFEENIRRRKGGKTSMKSSISFEDEEYDDMGEVLVRHVGIKVGNNNSSSKSFSASGSSSQQNTDSVNHRKIPISLSTFKATLTDYEMPQKSNQEKVEIKSRKNRKSNKSSSLRKSSAVLEDLLEESQSQNLTSMDHRSREEISKVDHEKLNEARKQKFLQAQAKSEALSRTLKNNLESDEDLYGDEDFEDKELQKQLSKSREKSNRAQHSISSLGDVLDKESSRFDHIKRAREHQEKYNEEKSQIERVVFSSSSQFADSFQLKVEPQSAPAESESVKLEMDSDVEMQSEQQTLVSFQESKESIDDAQFLGEPVLGKGIGNALSVLRSRGLLSSAVGIRVGRANDEKAGHFDYLQDDNTGIRLDYVDDQGRKLTRKEAFRQISHRFHNQKPSLKTREKRARKLNRELEMKRGAIKGLATVKEFTLK